MKQLFIAGLLISLFACSTPQPIPKNETSKQAPRTDKQITTTASIKDSTSSSIQPTNTENIPKSTTNIILQAGHQMDIMALSYSPDGKYLATGGLDRKLILWQTKTMLQYPLIGHNGGIISIDFNPYSNRMVSADHYGKIILWDHLNFKKIKSNNQLKGKNIKKIFYSKNAKKVWLLTRQALYLWNIQDNQIKLINNQLLSVKSAAISTDKKYLAIVGGDVTLGNVTKNRTPSLVKLFDTQTLQFINKLPRQSKRFNAVAFSPSGQYLALGESGRKPKIKIIDINSFKIISTLPVNNKVMSLVFSSDEKYLFSNQYVAYDKPGITHKWQWKKARPIKKISGISNRFLALHPKENLLVGGQENQLNIIETNDMQTIFQSKNYDLVINDLAVNVKKQIVAGFQNHFVYWDLKQLKINKSIHLNKNSDNISQVSFNPLNEIVIASSKSGMTSYHEKGKIITKHLPNADHFAYSRNTLDIVTGRKEGAGKQATALKIFGSNQKLKKSVKGPLNIVNKIIYSHNSKQFAVVGGKGSGLMIYNTSTHDLVKQIKLNHTLYDIAFNSAGDIYAAGKKYVYQWRQGDYKLINKIRIHQGYASSLAISEKNNLLAIGKGYSLEGNINFDVDLYQLNNFEFITSLKGHTGEVIRTTFTADEKYLITASQDGTFRLWNAKNPLQYFVFFGHDKNTYGVFSSDNFYTASAKAKDLVAYEQAGKLFPVSQFDAIYRRPDVLLKSVGYSEAQTIQLYQKAHTKWLKKMQINPELINGQLKVPSVNIDSHHPTVTNQRKINLKFSAMDKLVKLDHYVVYINNIPITGQLKNLLTAKTSLEIELSSGKNVIEVSVFNQQGIESLKDHLVITYKNKIKKPDLYLLSIGVSQFKDKEFNLNYAAKDAKDISRFFKSRSNDFNRIHLRTLTNQQATKQKILNSSAFLKRAKVDDKVIIFIASHGLLDNNLDYYLAMNDMNFYQPASNGLKYEDLEHLFQQTKSRNRLLLIDACNSGEVDDEELTSSNNFTTTTIPGVKSRGIRIKSKRKFIPNKQAYGLMQELFSDFRKGTGATVISSATGTEFAYESAAWNNGVFTFSLINGLKSKTADQNKDNVIRVSELKAYALNNVDKLTQGQQHPTSRIENTHNNFIIASTLKRGEKAISPTGTWEAENYKYYKELRRKIMVINKTSNSDIMVSRSYYKFNENRYSMSQQSKYKAITTNKYRHASGIILHFKNNNTVRSIDTYDKGTFKRVR